MKVTTPSSTSDNSRTRAAKSHLLACRSGALFVFNVIESIKWLFRLHGDRSGSEANIKLFRAGYFDLQRGPLDKAGK